jgi:hypothetical protein
MNPVKKREREWLDTRGVNSPLSFVAWKVDEEDDE